jgi:hypothetical protein
MEVGIEAGTEKGLDRVRDPGMRETAATRREERIDALRDRAKGAEIE